jgi:hypothetical protein
MDMNEFNATAIRAEAGDEVRFDVRPFGDRQGEAIDSYLHDLLAVAGYGAISPSSRVWVLLHDSTAAIPGSAYRWLENLKASGFAIEIRRV